MVGVGVRVRWRVWAGGNRENFQFTRAFSWWVKGDGFCPRFTCLKKNISFCFFLSLGLGFWMGGRMSIAYYCIIIILSSFAVASTFLV